MNITWLGAHANNFTVGRDNTSVKKIVIHWIVGTLESCDKTFSDGRRLASAHYGIGGTQVHQYVKEADTAWHAGNWDINQESIGIEHEGGWLLPDGVNRSPVSEDSIRTSIELVTDICKRYSIPADREHIKKHNEVSTKATACPGSLPIDRIVEEVGKNLAGPVINTDEQITLDFIKTNQTGGNLEGTVRAWKGAYDERPNLMSNLKQFEGLVETIKIEWKLPVSASAADVIAEALRLPSLEDSYQLLVDEVEKLVGTFDTDSARFTALQAFKDEKKTLTDELAKCQQQLANGEVVGSFKLFNLIFKVYKG
jgi:hypothetical protein